MNTNNTINTNEPDVLKMIISHYEAELKELNEELKKI